MPIRVLSETIAAQIAAGEVVERPASVVKELIENSLDAGARSITIEVREGGRRLIRVADDGCGILPEEVPVAFHRHSTSKLTSADDLHAIQTLGFRGEALASIASVAQVTMVTRVDSEPSGVRIRVEGGRTSSRETVGAPRGTVVGVENLFFNVPARLKFLRSKVTEKRHIDTLITRYAMAYAGVRFRLVHDNRLVFQSPGSGVFKDVLIEVYGLETARQMLDLGVDRPEDSPSPAIHVWGYASAPSLSRANRTHITLFVNGRWIQDRGLTYAVTQAYHTMLMNGRFPVAVVMVELPADRVDVNVHPTKAEVRFRNRDAVFNAVQRTIRRALVDSSPARSANLATGSEWGGGADARPTIGAALASLKSITQLQPELELPGGPAGQRIESATSQMGSEGQLAGIASTDTGGELPLLRIVGQIGALYIVAEGPAEMVLIDQHAAHERILYERLMAQRESGVATQTLLEAVPVDLPPDRIDLLEEHLGTLEKLGFLVEPFGGTTLLVRGLPALLGEMDPVAALEAVADDLERGDNPLEKTIEEQIVARICKTAAVKAGQVLTIQEMSAMIRQLEACTSPHTCPHGRPTMIRMSAGQLAKQFSRK